MAVVAELAAALLQLRKDRLLDHLAAAEPQVSGTAIRAADGGTTPAPSQAALDRHHESAAGLHCAAGSSDRSTAGAADLRAGTQAGSTVRIGAAAPQNYASGSYVLRRQCMLFISKPLGARAWFF